MGEGVHPEQCGVPLVQRGDIAVDGNEQEQGRQDQRDAVMGSVQDIEEDHGRQHQDGGGSRPAHRQRGQPRGRRLRPWKAPITTVVEIDESSPGPAMTAATNGEPDPWAPCRLAVDDEREDRGGDAGLGQPERRVEQHLEREPAAYGKKRQQRTAEADRDEDVGPQQEQTEGEGKLGNRDDLLVLHDPKPHHERLGPGERNEA